MLPYAAADGDMEMRSGVHAASSSLTQAARTAPVHGAVTLADGYAYCTRLATSHYENFTIASWLMPRAMRPHMHAIYAYARCADDFADEDHDLAKLDAWERELDLAYAGSPRHPVFVALADTVRKFEIPREPFADLLTAFRSDVNFNGFDSMEELLGYARYSANPVGRIVLYLFGYRDAERQRLSDLVCSGLQLANFWQDVAVDFAKGRTYFPRQDMARFAVTPRDLARGDVTAGFVDLMRHEIGIARAMLVEGSALKELVDRRLSRDIAMFAGGGLAILRAIERVDYDVFHRRPKLHKLDYLKLGWNAIRGRVEV
jgi:squalene synthase HpnC